MSPLVNCFRPRLAVRSIPALQKRLFFAKKCPKPVQPVECKSATTPVDNIPEGYKRIKEKQAKFQVDDGLPVWLKGGPTDRILYLSTLVLTGAGILGCLRFFITEIVK